MISERASTLSLFMAGIIIPAAVVLVSCLTPSILVTKEQNLGDVCFNNHDYNGAISHYTRMLDASRKLGIYRNLSMESEVHRKVANGYEMTGNYPEALKHVGFAIELDSAEKNVLNLITDLDHQGRIFVYMGSYFKGLSALEKSLALAEGMEQSMKNTNRLSVAGIYLSLAQVYSVTGKSSLALSYSDKALAIFRSAGESRGEMEALLTIGSVYSDLGDIYTARNIIENSLGIARTRGMGSARHNQLLASMESSLGEYEKALRHQEMALSEAKKLGIAPQVIWSTLGMGDIYRDLGDLEHAEKYYSDAKDVKETLDIQAGSLDASIGLRTGDLYSANRFFSSQGSLTGKSVSLYRMAEMMMRMNKPDSAILMLDEAAAGFRATGNNPGVTSSLAMKGRIFVEKGKTVMDSAILDTALSTAESPETIWQIWFQKGRIYEMNGNDDLAIESYRKSIDVIEKIRGNLTVDEFKSVFINNKRDVYDRLINLLLKNNRTADAFRYSEQDRARAFYDILANRKINFRGSSSKDLIIQEQEKRIEMQKLSSLIQKNSSSSGQGDEGSMNDLRQMRETLAREQTEYKDILHKIKLSNPSYAEMVAAEPPSLEDFQEMLDPETSALVYWISNENIILWVVGSESLSGLSINVGSKELTLLVENARKAIQTNTGNERELLANLYNCLIAPVADKIAGMKNLVIVPNGPLHFLPFQALIDPGGKYIVQQFNILYAPSAGVYRLCSEHQVKKASSFMGLALSDIEIDNKAGLPSTEDEVKNILPLFSDNTSAFGMDCTESFVKKNASSYTFLHFATHGSINYRQPLYSYLLFPASDNDDGRLNVYEVLEMNIDSKLVTLSACETGLGNISQGDELTGLSRAFLFAGSSSVLVSLWAVADYQTSVLMSAFYRYLKDHPVQQALTLAQREIIRRYPQPVYWSPFVLIGNGRITSD